jgi:RimJ/RimL family protein N-acetyltransferase
MGQAEQDGVGYWPLFGIELSVGDVVLNPLREADIGPLADIYPDDAEHDPGASLWSDMDLPANRKRLVVQGYWRNWGNWSPSSWCLAFRVFYRGRVVGTQSLEANLFRELRTVDSGSWLVIDARGHGVGTAMRTAILGLAFDHLGAEVAITASRTDNAPSIAVSRRLGYIENGVSRVISPTGPCELLHFRLDRNTWIASGKGAEVSARGLEGCSSYFGVEVA